MTGIETPRRVQNPDPLLSPEEAAEYLNVTPRWLRRMREKKKLAATKLGGPHSSVRYRRSALDQLIENGTEDYGHSGGK